jgi:hypothetical protein
MKLLLKHTQVLFIYNFDREQNVKPVKYQPDSIIHVGLDFNIDPMSGCLFHVKNGVSEFFDEIVIYSSNTEEFIDELLRRYPKNKVIIYPDPACRAKENKCWWTY